jgi:hypothetical protein
MKTKYIIAMLLLALVFNPLSILLGAAYWSNTHPDTGENIKTVAWLPPEATNVSYYKTYSWTAYEFDIDEDGFRKWSDCPLTPITEKIAVERYSYENFMKRRLGCCNEQYEHERATHIAIVTDGLHYSYLNPSAGGRRSVVYDREKHRAYFQSNPR